MVGVNDCRESGTSPHFGQLPGPYRLRQDDGGTNCQVGTIRTMAPWRALAALLVVSLSVVFAVLFIQQRRRIRYLLRNRLTPLTALSDMPTRIERWLPWAIVSVGVVVALVALAFS